MNIKTPHRPTFSLGACLLVLGCAGQALAQNALGTGAALDANLKLGSRINTPVNDFNSTLRFQNAIVTGNAAGGRSFRGSVGYRAVGEFGGGSAVNARFGGLGDGSGAGSDDLFSFQRDSIYSALPSVGIRGVDALQYQMRLSTGSSPGEMPVLPIVRRSTTSSGSSSLYLGSGSGSFQSQELDSYLISPGSLRSTSEYLTDSFMNPTLLRTNTGSELDPGAQFTIASPLRGISSQSAPTFTTDLISNDLLIPKLPSALPDLPRSPLQVSNFVEPRTASGFIEPRAAPNSYDRILDDLRQYKPDADPLKPGAGAITDPSRLLNVNPDRLSGNAALPGDANLLIPGGDPMQSLPGDPAQASPAPNATLQERLDQLRQQMFAMNPAADGAQGRRTALGQTEEEKARSTHNDRIRAQINETIELLRGASPVVSAFAAETNPHRDIFSEHMYSGQRAIAENRWFDAEEHFAGAMNMSPGDALAAAGRIHAEIGAGLFLSAAINLQKLLREQPGMVSVHYEAKLLPSPERVEQIRVKLRTNMSTDTPMGRFSALLFAYLGYQLHDPASIEEAFAAIDRITITLEEQPDPFYEIVRKVWRE